MNCGNFSLGLRLRGTVPELTALCDEVRRRVPTTSSVGARNLAHPPSVTISILVMSDRNLALDER